MRIFLCGIPFGEMPLLNVADVVQGSAYHHTYLLSACSLEFKKDSSVSQLFMATPTLRSLTAIEAHKTELIG